MAGPVPVQFRTAARPCRPIPALFGLTAHDDAAITAARSCLSAFDALRYHEPSVLALAGTLTKFDALGVWKRRTYVRDLPMASSQELS